MSASMSNEQWKVIQAKILADFKSGNGPKGGIDNQVRVDLPNGDFQLVDKSYLSTTEPVRVLDCN